MRSLGQLGCLIVAVCGLSMAGCGGSPDPAPAANSTPPSDPTIQPGPGAMAEAGPSASSDPSMSSDPSASSNEMMSDAMMSSEAAGGGSAYMSAEMGAADMEGYVSGEASADAMYAGGGPDMPGMYGGGNRSAGNPLVAAVAEGVQAQMASRMLTAVRAASSTKAPDKTPSMRDRANEAFVGGDEALALRYLYAHMASEYELANSTFGSVTFSPILREPVWWLRWGVSLHVRADELETPLPIVVGMQSPLPDRNTTRGRYGARGRAAGPAGGASPAAAPGMEGMGMEGMEGMEMGMGMGGSQPQRSAAVAGGVSPQIDETLSKNLGLVSEQVGAHLDSRFQDGSFGRGFQGVEVAPAVAPAAPGMRVDQRTGERIQEQPMTSDPSYEMEMSAGMSTGMPMPTAGSGEMQESEMMMMESMQGQGGMPQRGRAAAAAAPAAPSFQPDLPRWRPGLAFLGEVPLSESLATAKENGLQFVLHFDVIVQGKKTSTIVRVVNVADEKTLVTSKKLDNVECYKLVQAEKTTETEYVSEMVTPMLDVLDEKLKVVPMPTLTPEQALGRVASLLETAPAFDWGSMAEVRLFQSQGLLNEEQTATAMHLLGGDDALVLLYGMPAERREIVNREIEQ